MEEIKENEISLVEHCYSQDVQNELEKISYAIGILSEAVQEFVNLLVEQLGPVVKEATDAITKLFSCITDKTYEAVKKREEHKRMVAIFKVDNKIANNKAKMVATAVANRKLPKSMIHCRNSC